MIAKRVLAGFGIAFVAGVVVWFVLLPQFVEHQARGRVREAIVESGFCYVRMAEQFGLTGKFFPDDAKLSACDLPASSAHVAEFRLRGNRFEATLRNVHPELDGYMIYHEAYPDAQGKRTISWRCGTNAPEQAYRYLLVECARP